jgi:hypothetical protein
MRPIICSSVATRRVLLPAGGYNLPKNRLGRLCYMIRELAINGSQIRPFNLSLIKPGGKKGDGSIDPARAWTRTW